MRSGAWFAIAVAGSLVGASASADPVPVLTVSVRDRGPSAEQVAAVVTSLGADARSGDELRRDLLTRFGRYAPQEDVLRPQREAITAGENAYFAQGRAAGRRRIQPALTAMEAAPEALELQENNRAAYLKGLFLLARMAHEERHPDEAETWLRRAFAFDPWWMPSNYDCPERFRPIVARLRPAAATSSAPTATGTLSVRAPREGCTLSVDDTRSPSTAQTVSQSVPARTHRVSLRCAEVSRVRSVTITAGATASLVMDPRLDALLRVAELPGLNYQTAPESPAVVVSDAAAVGASLGVERVVLLTGDHPLVVDVRRGEVVHDAMSAQVERSLGLGAASPAPVGVAPPVDPRVDTTPRSTRGPGAGPWVLVGVGAGALVAGGVFFYLRGAPLDSFEDICPGGTCADEAARTRATPFRDDASLYTTLAFVSAGVGVAAVAGGLIWYAVAPRRSSPVALRASPWASPGALGLSLDARF